MKSREQKLDVYSKASAKETSQLSRDDSLSKISRSKSNIYSYNQQKRKRYFIYKLLSGWISYFCLELRREKSLRKKELKKMKQGTFTQSSFRIKT